MGRKCKVNYERKIEACEKYLSNQGSFDSIAAEYGIDKMSVARWLNLYKSGRPSALLPLKGNNQYSEELKMKVVEEYIEQAGSLTELVNKYHLRSSTQILAWLKKYTEGKRLETYHPMPEVYKMPTKKTTKEERIEIVHFCIDNGKDYKKTAAHYGVKYSQIYSWVKKYLENGEEGLNDNRGHHKTDDEVDELERLRRENKRLKAQLEDARMTEILLKKVQEIERRRYSPKDD